MSRLIESICIIDGKIRNLEYHQRRMVNARWKLFGLETSWDLSEIIKVEDQYKFGKYKCRIIFEENIESIEITPYTIRPIQSIQLVENHTIEYKFKFENRDDFQLLKDSVTEDEIIIVQNGKITDTSYSNLVFYDGEDWVTPTSFLLNGTMRQQLLATKKMKEAEIRIEDLKNYNSFKLINAMMNLDESPELLVSVIR